MTLCERCSALRPLDEALVRRGVPQDIIDSGIAKVHAELHTEPSRDTLGGTQTPETPSQGEGELSSDDAQYLSDLAGAIPGNWVRDQDRLEQIARAIRRYLSVTAGT